MRYVYLVRAGQSQYKIGIASNILSRVRALQTSNAELIEVITAKQTPDAHVIEKSIHKKLQDMKLDGGREWFSLTPEVVINIAIKINHSPGISVSEVELLYNLIEEQNNRQRAMTGKMQALLDQIKAETPKKPSIAKENKPQVHRPTAEERADEDKELAMQIFIEAKKASTSLLQREMRIGYGRAARIINRLEKDGHISPPDGARPRVVLI